MLELSILVLCRTGSRGAFLGVIPQLFSPHKAKISRVSNPKTSITSNTIILGCQLVLALRNPILESFPLWKAGQERRADT